MTSNTRKTSDSKRCHGGTFHSGFINVIIYDMTYLLTATGLTPGGSSTVEASWNVMAHAQKTDFVFRRNGWIHLIQRGRQFSRLLAAEVCESAVVMLDTPCSEVVWRVLATHYIRKFLLHFPSRASPCSITFQLETIDLRFFTCR